jgi:hypothetical protein
MKTINTNVTFNTYNDEHRTAFDIISNPDFSMLSGLSIPTGICLYKNKMDERSFPELGSDTFTNKCIPEGIYNKLFNLACYTSSIPTNKTHKHKTYKTRNNFKKSKLAGNKTSNKNKNKIKT